MFYFKFEGQINFLTPAQLHSVGKSNPAAALQIAQSLASGGIQLSPIMARSLGANLLPNSTTNMSTIGKYIYFIRKGIKRT